MQREQEFQIRMDGCITELRTLYLSLYEDETLFLKLCENLRKFYEERPENLKQMDKKAEKDKNWYKKKNMLGMTLYIDDFAGDLRGIVQKIPYFQDANVNYIHLMPFLKSSEGYLHSEYAVSDFRAVKEKFGTIEDFRELTKRCHEKGIYVSMDLIMNHTSEGHEWAKLAKKGVPEYQERYFFFDNYVLPGLFERTVPQVFPTTAPGNFTWLKESQSYVMTTFYPDQWDLNYANPIVFYEMIGHFLYWANCGIDIMRLDALPYIWKEINTPCRNLPQVHMIVRMLRLINEIVCPSVLLLGEVEMELEQAISYFGTVEKPECHFVHSTATMATIWNSVATRDIRLLKNQIDRICSLPKESVFFHSLRCHREIEWKLDYHTLASWGMQEESHKNYLNDFFTGKVEGSFSLGELYEESLYFQDGKFCGTTASMCGIEKAIKEQEEEKLNQAIQLDLMLHAYLFMQPGIPVLYRGDELGQLNDTEYKREPQKKKDPRYLFRGRVDWELAQKREQEETVQGKLFQGLKKLEEIRKTEKVYMADADCHTVSTWDESLLCLVREAGEDKIIGLFNFSEEEKIAWIDEQDDLYRDMDTQEVVRAEAIKMKPYGFRLFKRMNLAVPKKVELLAKVNDTTQIKEKEAIFSHTRKKQKKAIKRKKIQKKK